MGPVVLITIGVLFLIQEFSHDYFTFVRLSPIILIMIGAVKILRAVAPSDGHIGTDTPTPAAAGAAQPNGQ